MNKKKICLQISSEDKSFRAFAILNTKYVNPGEGGFAKLILQVNDKRVGHVIFDWPRASRRELPSNKDVLVAHAGLDEVHAKLEETVDLTQLIVEAMRRQKWIFFTGIGPRVSKKDFDARFEAWITKNI